MVKIDINEVKALMKRKDEINAIDFKDIQWMDGDKVVEISQKILDDWQFIGLCNTNFIGDGFYLTGWAEVISFTH